MGVKLSILLLCATLAAKEAEGINLDARDVSEELTEISYLMQSMATDLRNDQTHERVQLDGKEIEDRLERLCRWHEEIDRQRKEISKDARGKRGSNTISQKADEKIAEGDGFKRKWNFACLSAIEGVHGEDGEEIPAKWLHRIQAYFVSIVAADK